MTLSSRWLLRLILSLVCLSCAKSSEGQAHILGKAYHSGAEYGKAADYFQKAIDQGEGGVEAIGWLGFTYDKSGDDSTALKYYNEAIDLNPDYGNVYFFRAQLYERLGNLQLAADDYVQCLRLFPENLFYVHELGWVYAFMGDYSRALSLCDTLVLKKPAIGRGYEFRGTIWRMLGEHKKALEDYERAIERDTTLATAYAYLGFYKMQSDNPETKDVALKDINTAIGLNPKNALYYHIRNTLYTARKEYLSALTDIDKCLALDPNNEMYYFNKGWLRITLGDDQSAIEEFNRAIELNPSIKNLIERAATFGRLKMFQRGIEDLHRILEIDSVNTYALSTLGEMHQSLGHQKEAISYFKMALQVDNKYANAILGLGKLYDAIDDKERAIHYYSKLLRLDSTNTFASFWRGRAYIFLGEREKALADFNHTISIDSLEPRLLLNRGMLLFDMGDTLGALDDYNKILGIASGYVDAYIYRGILKMNCSGIDAARFDFADALYHSKDHARTHYLIGHGKLRFNEYKAAQEDFRKSIELDVSYPLPYMGIAKCQIALGDVKSACSNFREAQRLGLRQASEEIKKYCK
jgi:tetratricopeptide (TPR) repeat protein